MSKTKEELEKLKEDYKKLGAQINELSNEELENVTGGCGSSYSDDTYGTLCIAPSSAHNQYFGYHPLITTVGNSCSLIEGASTCLGCKYRASGGLYNLVSYCKARSEEVDRG